MTHLLLNPQPPMGEMHRLNLPPVRWLRPLWLIRNSMCCVLVNPTSWQTKSTVAKAPLELAVTRTSVCGPFRVRSVLRPWTVATRVG